MTLTEKAWESINKSWHPYEPADDNKTLTNIRYSLRKLQRLRLPIAAIDEIKALLKAHEDYILEGVECPECGIRGDETVICSDCGNRVYYLDVDSVNGHCVECQEKNTCHECGNDLSEDEKENGICFGCLEEEP